jgi:polyferredoxin
MTLGLALGLVVSTTLLTLFFFLVITPIGWIARLAGQDFLSLKLNPKAPSYWLKRPAGNPPQAADYERQF